MRKLGLGLMVVLNVLWAGAGWAAKKALVPETGQTTSFAAGDDGALQKGVASSAQRFTDKGKGVIKDNLTGLTWLTNANCKNGTTTWQGALNLVAELNTSGTMNGNNCGDTSGKGGSHATDWRLPNRNELTSLLDLGTVNPALPAGHPFLNFVASSYWSSTTLAGNPGSAWLVDFSFGDAFNFNKSNNFFVIAVRGGS